MRKLYSIDYNSCTDDRKKTLYVRCNGNRLDYLTYFGGFSIGKWRRYTTLNTLAIKFTCKNKYEVVWKILKPNGEIIILDKNILDNKSCKEFCVKELPEGILGCELIAQEEMSEIPLLSYWGEFSSEQDVNLQVVICTYKREEYVNVTIEKLRSFSHGNSWLSGLVIDNGRTLPIEQDDNIKVIHNLNYGGSGGFTRGILETINDKKITHVLLMDDDISLDTTAIERIYAVLKGQKEEFYNCFISGAMLSMENPTIQVENTAVWNRVILKRFGANFDLKRKEFLSENERVNSFLNRYGAWWCSCMPVARIKQIGLPLPVFVKGDDMEYGIRNKQEIISMNGICVWHKGFVAKQNDVVDYYTDRNMMMIGHYSDGVSLLFTRLTVIMRVVRRLIQRKSKGGKRSIYLALYDYFQGFDYITKIGSDEKMTQVVEFIRREEDVSYYEILKLMVKVILDEKKTRSKYINFRQRYLMDDVWWRKFLKTDEKKGKV